MKSLETSHFSTDSVRPPMWTDAAPLLEVGGTSGEIASRIPGCRPCPVRGRSFARIFHDPFVFMNNHRSKVTDGAQTDS